MNKVERITRKLNIEVSKSVKNIKIPIFVENDKEVVVSLYLPKKEVPFLVLDYRYNIITNLAQWTDENFTNKEKLEILNAIMIAFEKTMEEENGK